MSGMTVAEMRKRAANADAGGFVQAHREWTATAESAERQERIIELLVELIALFRPPPEPKHQKPKVK